MKFRKNRSRRKRSSELVLAQRKLWALCREIIRKKYPHVCYTCGADNLEGVHLQTGHMITKKALPYQIKWDIRLLRPQCPACNKTREGMGAIFYRTMLIADGQEYVDDILADYYIYRDDHLTNKQKLEFINNKMEDYKTILSSL